MHEGHRGRMIERLESYGGSLRDHELLEILLFNAIPRKNTNELAHTLLNVFGDIEGIFRAKLCDLESVKGVGKSTAAYLKTVALLYGRIIGRSNETVNVSNVSSMYEYLEQRYRNFREEVVELFGLDKESNIRSSMTYTSGAVDEVKIPPEEVSRFLFLNRPASLVVAHNHVNCTCKPTASDEQFTLKLFVLCRLNNVDLYDHVVVGSDGYYSYFSSGRLQVLKDGFADKKVFQ